MQQNIIKQNIKLFYQTIKSNQILSRKFNVYKANFGYRKVNYSGLPFLGVNYSRISFLILPLIFLLLVPLLTITFSNTLHLPAAAAAPEQLDLHQVIELYNSGEYLAAAELLEQQDPKAIAELTPAEYYQQLGFIYYEEGRLEQYVENLNRASELEPGDLILKLQAAIASQQTGNYSQASETFHALITQLQQEEEHLQSLNSIQQKRLLYYIGQNARDRGRLEQARHFWQAGLELGSNQARFLLALAEVEERLENIEKALEYYLSAVENDSSLNYLYPRIAELYEEQENYFQAWEYWRLSQETGIQTELARNRQQELAELYPDELEAPPEVVKEIKFEFPPGAETLADIWPEDIPEPDFDLSIPLYEELLDELEQEEKLTEEELKQLELAEEWRWEPNWREVQPLPDFPEAPQFEIGISSPRSNLIFQVDSDFIIENSAGVIILSRGNAYTEYEISINDGFYALWKDREHLETFDGTQNLYIRPQAENASIMVQGVRYGAGYFFAGIEDRQYRGEMRIQPTAAGKLQPVSLVNLEEYLLSVVPAEMSAGWPMEALRAQALAARSFALHNKGRRQASRGFDLFDTVSDAVYAGVGREHHRTTEAVISTAGEVGMYNGEVVNAVFSSNSGGHTEASRDVWGGDVDYLSGANLSYDVLEPRDSSNRQEDLSQQSQQNNEENLNQLNQNFSQFPLLPGQLQTWFQSRPETFSGTGPYTSSQAYRWSREINVEFLKTELELSEIQDVRIGERSDRGFVTEIAIIGRDEEGREEEVLFSGDRIRSALGGLRSNSFVLHRQLDSSGELEKIILYGGGWGHGVGMDQTAAGNMADQGWDYASIFKYFYQDISLENIYQ